jgi:hypothetical protein
MPGTKPRRAGRSLSQPSEGQIPILPGLMHGPVPAGLVLVIEIVLSSPTTRAPKPGERSSDPAEHGRLPLLCAVPLSSLPDASTRRPAAHDGLGERRGRSARGPYRIGNLGIRAGRSGHDRYEGTAGPSTFPAYELGRPTSVEAASNPTSGTPTDLLIRASPSSRTGATYR